MLFVRGIPLLAIAFWIRVVVACFAVLSMVTSIHAGEAARTSPYYFMHGVVIFGSAWSVLVMESCVINYAVREIIYFHNPSICFVIMCGDWVDSILSFCGAGAAIAISLVDFAEVKGAQCLFGEACWRYQLPIVFAFLHATGASALGVITALVLPGL